MNIIAKELIPDKEWIVKKNDNKIGTIAKIKKGYTFLKNGRHTVIQNLDSFPILLPKKTINSCIKIDTNIIYDYPCSSKPFFPIYNLKKRLPIFAKSVKSKSLFCAGYYVIQFRKGWVKSFCPKLITLERYPYKGPFKTEQEVKNELVKMNKNETT